MKKQRAALSVAIVDDDESVLDAVKTVLDDQDWVTQTYTSGESFLSNLNDMSLDCIILDANLLGMSGEAVAQTVIKDFDGIPIIVFTAYPDSPQTTKIKALGVPDVLVKPVTAKLLIERIQELANVEMSD